LQADNRFAAHPIAASIKRVTRDHEHVRPIAGNAAVAPNSTANRRGSPGTHAGRIVNIHAYDPAMVVAAVSDVPGVGHVDDAVHQCQGTPIFLHNRRKVHAVVLGGIYIYRPTRIGRTTVNIE
jgi:hypothetical protein